MSRGHDRERQVRQQLELDGWVVVRAAGSLGVVDLIALKRGERPRLIEVKSTAGSPYERFGPAKRLQLAHVADLADADALLAWWPPNGELHLIDSSNWPERPLGGTDP